VRRYPISLIHGAGLIGCGQLNKDLRTLSFRISGCGALTGAVDVFLNPSDYLPVATQLGIKALIEGGTVTNAAHSTVAAAWPRSPGGTACLAPVRDLDCFHAHCLLSANADLP